MSRIYCGRWQDSIPASGHPVSMVQALPRDVITLEQLASIFRHTCRFVSFIFHVSTKLSNNKILYMILIQIGFQNSSFLLHYPSTVFGGKNILTPTWPVRKTVCYLFLYNINHSLKHLQRLSDCKRYATLLNASV